MKIEKYLKKDIAYKIIKKAYELEFGADLKKYETEMYFVAYDSENLICGVSRFAILTGNELLREGFKIFDLKDEELDDKEIYYLSGIWVEKEQRNQGIGKKLLEKRMNYINQSDIVITDVRKTSSLIDIYKDKYGFKEIAQEEKYIILKKF